MTHEVVPVDQRWLGMDKRGIPYAVVALVLIAVLLWVVPAIDDATAWNNPTVAGDLIDLGDGITIAPPAGWQLEQGIRTTEESATPVNSDAASATLSNGATTVTVTGSGWTGTATELMDQYNRVRDASDEDPDRQFAVTGERSSFTTATGLTGVQES